MMWKSALLLLVGTSFNSVDAYDLSTYDGTRTSFQNGRLNGDIFAGGLDYAHDMLFATGETRGSNGDKAHPESMCFTSRFNMDQLNNHTETLTGNVGNGTIRTTCSALSMMQNPTHYLSPYDDKPFVVIGTEFLSESMQSVSSEKTLPHGFAIAELPWEKKVDGILSLNDKASHSLSYPTNLLYVHQKEVSGDNGSDDGVAIVASAVSKNTHIDTNTQFMYEGKNIPDVNTELHLKAQFSMNLQMFDTKFYQSNIKNAMHLDNTATFEVNSITYKGVDIRPDAMVSGMILTTSGDILVSGYTSGSGAAYGVGSSPSNVDGFITALHPTLKLRGDNPTTRIASEKQDMILGMCNDMRNPHFFYVVGTTGDRNTAGDLIDHEGVFEDADIKAGFATYDSHNPMYGFVQKRRVDTLETVWGRYWPAVKSEGGTRAATAGVDCKHLKDGTLYVAGVVENGAHVVKFRSETHNFDDIVAMNLNDETGATRWFTQFGSVDGFERVAKNGAIAVDKYNNMIIFGDTTGSMFRKRDDTTDTHANIYLATLLEKTGQHDIGNWIKHHNPEEVTGQLSGGNWKDEEITKYKDHFTTEWIAEQSGPTAGSVFPAGLIYDKVRDQAFTTGIVDNPDNKKSTCMISKFEMTSGTFDGFTSAEGAEIGTTEYHEVCNSIAFFGSNEVVVIGSAENGSSVFQSKGSNAARVGFAAAFDRNSFHETAGHTFDGSGAGGTDQNLLYPSEIAVNGQDLYVLSMLSTDVVIRDEFTEAMNSDTSPNWLNIPQYGTAFDLDLSKISRSGDTMELAWNHKSAIDVLDHSTGTGVDIGGVIVKGGYVTISGSTRSTGAGFGEENAARMGDYEDAFFAAYHMDTGELVNSQREDSVGDTFVVGMCDDPNDPTSLYVVGGTSHTTHATDGDDTHQADTLKDGVAGSIYGFVYKVNAVNLNVEWKHVIGAVHHNNGDKGGNTKPTTTKAVDCAVSGDTIYVVGDVLDDASIVAAGSEAHNSRGGDDIWFASMKTNGGEQNWISQAGSSKDDHIAPRGGAVIKKEGNLLIHGDTNGEFFRFHQDQSYNGVELFLLEVGPDGKHQPSIHHDFMVNHPNSPLGVPNEGTGHMTTANIGSGHSNYPHAAPVAAPQQAPVSVSSVSLPAPVPVPVPVPVPAPVPVDDGRTSPPFLYNEDIAAQQLAPEPEGISTGAVIALSLVGSFVFVAILIILFYFYRRKTTGKEKNLSDGIISPPNGSFKDDPNDISFNPSDTNYTDDDPSENIQIGEDKGIV